MTPPAFPGAVGISHLRVYTSVGPDGLRGGTPHLHTVCSEAYWVIAGHGVVQTLTADGYAEVPLEPGGFVWFTPGTVHRLVNLDGELEILVIMQNAGLPEAGDMVITFPDAVLADPAAYRVAAALPPDGRTTAGDDGAVRLRRDRAVDGFLARRDDPRGVAPALRRLHHRAAALVRPRLEAWRADWEQGALVAALATGDQLDHLAAGRSQHLGAASVHRLAAPSGPRRHGCCGTLGVLVPADGVADPGGAGR